MLAYSRERKEVIETLPDEPAEGGEGWVYKTTEAGTLAKIFKEPAAEHRREKVEALIASPPHDPPQAPDGHRRFAWPQELLYDVKTGEFFGYTLAQIPNSKPLDQFFDPGASEYREKSFRVRLAIAVAELIADIHRHHLMLVVGDINPSNILADARGRVALIDLDSVQMTTPDGQTYPCPVGSTYYTPAELIGLGKKLGQVRRTQEHDRFGLAAIIFQLLFDGCHPFAAVGNDCTPLDRIRAGDWPYTNGAPYRPPPSAPPFRALPQAMQTIFTRTFVEGHWDPTARPTAEDWVEALTQNEKALGRPPTAAPVLAPQVPPLAPAPRRGVTAYVAAAAVVAAAALGFFGARWLHGASRAPEFASPPMWDPGTAVTDVFRDRPRDPKARSEAPRYWRHLRDGSDGRLSFEIADGTDTRREP